MKAAVDKDKCVGCGACVDVCPVGAIKVENDIAIVNDDCIECGACVDTCPVAAISI
ncbi:MAG: DUF362 domain-containing protein [Clostridiaceae bacterium]